MTRPSRAAKLNGSIGASVYPDSSGRASNSSFPDFVARSYM